MHSHVPYKRCPSTLHRIVKRIWITKDIPEDWGQAFVVLLSKDPDILDKPSEFRPIAITNTVGKIFFSVISDRLQKFFVQNNYIRRETQKGFLFGLPGCLEHSFTLFEALRDAKENQRQIIVAWIDLANAYGSVRHNLIQFALNCTMFQTAFKSWYLITTTSSWPRCTRLIGNCVLPVWHWTFPRLCAINNIVWRSFPVASWLASASR